MNIERKEMKCDGNMAPDSGIVPKCHLIEREAQKLTSRTERFRYLNILATCEYVNYRRVQNEHTKGFCIKLINSISIPVSDEMKIAQVY